MATVIYSPEKEKPQPRKASLTLSGVLLEPGFNTIEQKHLDVIKNHPDFSLYESWGAIQVVQDELPLLAHSDLNMEESSDGFAEESVKPKRRRSSSSSFDV